VELRDVSRMINTMRQHGCATLSTEIGRIGSSEGVSVFLSISYPAVKYTAEDLISIIHDINGVLVVDLV